MSSLFTGRLLAISDLHLNQRANRDALANLGHHPDDWLILAGDVGETEDHLAEAFGVLAPLTVLGLDVWDAHVEHTVAAPSWDVGTLVGMLYLAVVAGIFALVPAVLLGGVLGAANGAVARHRSGRTVSGAAVR